MVGMKSSPLSPLLANLFLHYALDNWLATNHAGIPFVVTQMMGYSITAAPSKLHPCVGSLQCGFGVVV